VETIDLPALNWGWNHVTLTLANPASDGAIISIGLKTTVAWSHNDDWNDIYLDKFESLTTGNPTDPLDAIVIKDSTASYLVVSNASQAIVTSDGITWSALTGCKGYLAAYDNRLVSIDEDGTTMRFSVAGNIDDFAGTGSGTFPIAEDLGTVHDLFTGKLLTIGTNTLYIVATKGWWGVDFTTQRVYRQEVQFPPLDNAGKVGIYHNANIWIATGAGITRVGGDTAVPVGPDLDDGLPSGYQGFVYDMTRAGNWLIYCVNGGSANKSSIFKLNTTGGGNLQVYTTAAINTEIKCVHHSPSSQYARGRLWFGEGTSVKYVEFPDTTPNVTQVSSYNYVLTSGKMELPIFRKMAAIPKVALGVAAITHGCDAGKFIQLYQKVNDAAAWGSVVATFNASPRDDIYTFNSGLGTAFYTIQLAVDFTTDSSTSTPELESLILYYIPAPDKMYSWTLQIQSTTASATKIITDLRTLSDTKTLLNFYPEGDASKTGHKVKITTDPFVFHAAQAGQAEGTIEVTMEEVFKG